MIDFGAMLTNEYGWLKFFHTIFSGYVVAAFFVMGVSAYHLLKKANPEFFKRSFKTAATFGLLSSLLVFFVGDFHAVEVAKTQPTKFAAMESIWETQKALPYNLLVIPDAENERNTIEAIGISGFLSYLAFHDTKAEITGLKAFSKENRPPVVPTFLSFRGMAALGILFMLTLVAFIISVRNKIESSGIFLRIMLYAIPLPYIAAQLGWIVAEVGRQPWIVYGVLKTSDAVSKSITPLQVWGSLAGFSLLYGALALVDISGAISDNPKRQNQGTDQDEGGFIAGGNFIEDVQRSSRGIMLYRISSGGRHPFQMRKMLRRMARAKETTASSSGTGERGKPPAMTASENSRGSKTARVRPQVGTEVGWISCTGLR